MTDRLAILGAWAPHRDEDACARAARRLGHAARVFDVQHWTQRIKGLAPPLIERALERFQPDFILCTTAAWQMGEARLKRMFRNRATAMWYFDAQPHPSVIALARQCRTLYLTAPAQRDAYLAAGVPIVRFLPAAMEPERDYPATRIVAGYSCDASFVGSGPYPYRWPILAAVSRICRLQVRGPGWKDAQPPFPVAGGPVHGRRFAEVVANASVSLGASALAEQETTSPSASDRMWRVMGCGGAFIGSYVPGIERFARHGEHCLWYRSPDECVEHVRLLLGDPERRTAMAARGRAHALAHHTYDKRVDLILKGREYE
jgi:hypothetical protein